MHRLTLNGRPLPLVGHARIYVCGVTPYDVTHLGHAATFVWVDALVRVLRYDGIRVELCRNVTDVDDQLVAAGAARGERPERLASVQQFWFDRDMDALSVLRPDHEPRSHNFVDEVVALAAALVDKDLAYVSNGSVYFRGAELPARHGLTVDEARGLLEEFHDQPDDPHKQDPLDVAMWRASTGDDPAWPSPWGPGRPGWHAECTAMVLSTYGASVDVHAGGADLRFPHHAVEAAQGEALTGVAPFARSWFHVGTVRVGSEKMAKSTGNLVLVADVLAKHSAAALRLLLLNRPWSQAWSIAPHSLDEAETQLEALYAAAGRADGSSSAAEAVLAALRADLDVPRAVSIALDEGGPAARVLTQILALA